MKILKVETRSKTTYRKDAEEQFGSWEHNMSSDVVGAKWLEDKEQPQLYRDEVAFVEFDDAGDDVFVLAVIYGDGDTFGHESGKICPAIASNSTKYLREVRDYLEAYEWQGFGYTHSHWDHNRDVVVGETCKYPIYEFPWNGYFARIERTQITLVEVDPSE